MALLPSLSVLALRQLIDGVCKSIGVSVASELSEKVVQFLSQRFSDQSQRLLKALASANGRAWQTLEISLARDSFFTQCRRLFAPREEQAFRRQVQVLLDATPLAGELGPDFRQECLRQLRLARKAGVLSGGVLEAQSLARRAGEFARFAEPALLLEAERQVLAQMADELAQADYRALAHYISLETPGGTTLLATAVRYFFRRQVETDRELFQGLAVAHLEQLEQAQETGFAALADLLTEHGDRLDQLLGEVRDIVVTTHDDVLDIKTELERQGQQLQELGQAVLRALEQNRLPGRDLRPGDSLSINSPGERHRVRTLLDRYRSLPLEERRRLPALLNGLGVLEAASGDFDQAQRDFREVARLVEDPIAQAAAQHNAFLAALEQKQWEEALLALQRALALAPERFAPFPRTKYEALRILGAGGFGVAFLCKHRNTGSLVVIKSLRPEGLEREVAEVFREAQVLEQLDHPAIIRLRDCDFADAARTRPFLVMEYFDGPTLGDHVAQHGPLSPDELLAVARPMAEALQAAHDRQILHRDVKPANLLVRKEAARWHVKLIDFGLAMKRSVLLGPSAPSTVTGYSVAGTRDFAAPEQMGLLPGVGASPASDIYGFARTCCFALFKTVQPLRKHWSAVPGSLADLLEHCLAETPTERPSSFTYVLEKLEGKRTVAAVTASSSPPPPLVIAAEPAVRSRVATAAPPREQVRKATELHRFEGHTGAITCVALSADGRRAASGGRDAVVRVWDLSAKKACQSFASHAKPIGSVAFFPDGRSIISSAADHTVRLTDLATGAQARCFDKRANWAVALSPDGKQALAGSVDDGILVLWNVKNGEDIRRLQGHADSVRGIAFSPDGRLALSSSRDQTVRLWEVSTGRQRQCFNVPKVWLTSICFTADGQHVLTGLGCDVCLWDLKTGQEVGRLKGHSHDVLAVAVAADGRRAVSGSVDQTVRVWDLESCTGIACLSGHKGEVAAVALSPDGRYVLSGGEDRTVRYWEVDE